MEAGAGEGKSGRRDKGKKVVGGSVAGGLGFVGHLPGLGVDEMSKSWYDWGVILISDRFTTRQSLNYRLEPLLRNKCNDRETKQWTNRMRDCI